MSATERRQCAEIISLSKNPQFPCLYLEFQHVPFLLDCALEFLRPPTSVHNAPIADASVKLIVPRVSEISIEQVDFILITNSYNILALPFITEYTAFKGRIFATEPTVEFGRLLMEEMVGNLSRDPYTGVANYLVHFEKEVHPLYSLHDIESCISKIERVHYSEYLDLGGDVEIVARSSGFCLGGANWMIKSPNATVTYMAASSNSRIGHSTVIDVVPFSKTDATIVAQLGTAPSRPLGDMITNMLNILVKTLEQGGNVLLPVNPCGTMFELIAIISEYLRSCGLVTTPIHIVSSIAKRSLHLANIQGEWMSLEKQANLYEARQPLIHGRLLEDKLLFHHDFSASVYQYRGPYIVFVGHPSLQAGQVRDFLNVWKNDPRNLMVVTELLNVPPVKRGSAEIMKMQICKCPMETRLDLNEIATRTNAKNLVIPLRAGVTIPEVPPTLQKGTMFTPLSPFQSTHIPFDRDFVRCSVMDQDLKDFAPILLEAQSEHRSVVVSGNLLHQDKLTCQIRKIIAPFDASAGRVRPTAEEIAARCGGEFGSHTIHWIPNGYVIEWDTLRLSAHADDFQIEGSDMGDMDRLRALVVEFVKSPIQKT
ncbi:uncharacterized protein SPPG_04496 [Spizellomyces punctatus DAOM BR117]|uniref:Beta-Casp domain-containing protein n=1 Tax=Spizellomyces punctatus (strain DAOM BR117) TaxID=645134 RepID=A0A0L0HH02_SPIPD|nr:uncharacterized protein SPPG_04496 [Spizellomyces punctatus DAOM BR117]KND00155.1 hypothetical protein SPPG_04496 [Spizellomyces punctatus DAOM BR117]|eukprot:XP_016608194.1 hypothetical protein SPPG_04496 [Spizellomyces punctatus DAOM BR117]